MPARDHLAAVGVRARSATSVRASRCAPLIAQRRCVLSSFGHILPAMPSIRTMLLALSATAAAGAVLAPGAAGTTPGGPATLRGVWLGASTGIAYPPHVVVAWTIEVGPGSEAGPVRLQLVAGTGELGTLLATSPSVDLPAEPGSYTFTIPPGQGLKSPSGPPATVSIAQTVGKHQITRSWMIDPRLAPEADPFYLNAVDWFFPALAAGDHDVPRFVRSAGEQLAVTVKTERDVDQDGWGDETQDVGDLRVVSARIVEHTPRAALVAVRVRNVGTTVRNDATLVAATGTAPCPASSCPKANALLAPGAEVQLRRWFDVSRGELTRIAVRAEGPDTNPADNSARLAPFVALSAPVNAAASEGIRLRVGLARAGTVKVAARVAGIDFGRTLRFSGAERRTILLTPARAADRRHLARALRRPGRLDAIVTADAGGVPARLRLKL
jgi:hypothetical protein